MGLFLFAGRVRNIYFPFDIETDTALSVATEMVAELDITDQDVTKIADMIDEEIASLVPEWKPGPGIEETPRFSTSNLCHNCTSNHTSNGSLMDFLAKNPSAKNLQIFQCSNGCAAMHGRFEEITYQFDGADAADHHIPEDEPEELHCTDIWDKHESRELSSLSSGESPSDEEYEKINHSIVNDERGSRTGSDPASNVRNSISHFRNPSSSSAIPSMSCALSDDCENEIQQELRWLKAKYQMELRELRDLQLGHVSKPSNLDNRQLKLNDDGLFSTHSNISQEQHSNGVFLKSSAYDKHCTSSNCASEFNKHSPNLVSHQARNCEAKKGMIHEANAKSFYSSGSLLPCPIHRTMSLPVDAVDI